MGCLCMHAPLSVAYTHVLLECGHILCVELCPQLRIIGPERGPDGFSHKKLYTFTYWAFDVDAADDNDGGRDELDLLVRASQVPCEADAVRCAQAKRIFCVLRDEMRSIRPRALVVRLDEALGFIVFAERGKQLNPCAA